MADITWGALEPGTLERIVVVQPHFDDAALGAAYLLAEHPGSTVVTVCGGRPDAYPDPPSDWDALGGFTAGDDVVAIRRDEDLAALAILEAEPIWLDFVDHQYLTPETMAAPQTVADALEGAIDEQEATAVFLPMGLANPNVPEQHWILQPPPPGWERVRDL